MITPEQLLYALENLDDEAILAAHRKRKTTPQPVVSPRRLRSLLIAAVLLIALAVTAIAFFGGKGDFLSYFSRRTNSPLTTQQEEFIDDRIAEINETAVVDDWTVSIHSAVCGRTVAYIRYRVTAPEGTDLERMGCYFDDYSLKYLNDADKPALDGLVSVSAGQEKLEDRDGAANTVDFMLKIHRSVTAESDFSYTDGAPRVLTLTDFMDRDAEYPFESRLVKDGEWVFTLNLTADESLSDTEIEWITEPVRSSGLRMSGAFEEVTITALRLNPFGGTLEYKMDEDDTPEALDFIGTKVIMEDGTSIDLWPKSGAVGIMSFEFDAPIIPENVASVLLPDGLLLHAPE